MLDLNLKETRIYQEIKQEGREEGELRGKLAAVPLLVKAGVTVEEIAEQMDIDIALIQQAIEEQAQ